MTLDRRTFLARSGALAAVAAVGDLGFEVLNPQGFAAAAARLRATPKLPSATPILVMIDLQGGNDATNMLINSNDPWYYDKAQGHGAIAIPHNDVLPLVGTTYGLHPALSWTADRFSTHHDVAFVRGTGENVVHEFSHFAAMHYRQIASFSGAVSTGWLGRTNDRIAPKNPFASVSIDGVHPALVGANTPVLSVPDIRYFNFDVGWEWEDGWLNAWQAMSGAGWPAGSPTQAAEQNIGYTFEAQAATYAAWNPAMDATFAGSTLGHQLSQVAMMITAEIPSRTYVVTLSGFDTHGGETDAQTTLFAELDLSLKQFFAALAPSARASDVVVYLTSEFGRQQTANGSGGCDHGQAGTDVLIGAKVKGGLYGEAPKTAPKYRLDDALVPTVDFRSVYATILNHLTGGTAVSHEVLSGTYEDLRLFV